MFNRFFLVSFNETIARSRNVNVFGYDLFFSVMIAFIVTLAVQWIGILVINSLLVLPAATARNISSNLRAYILIALFISLISCVTGLVLSFYLSTAAGATIVLVAIGFYVLSLMGRLCIGK